jgi:maleate isomerase
MIVEYIRYKIDPRGNGFRAAGAIDALERTIGRPVVTSNQVLLWSLLGRVATLFEVAGHGRLFAQPRPVL